MAAGRNPRDHAIPGCWSPAVEENPKRRYARCQIPAGASTFAKLQLQPVPRTSRAPRRFPDERGRARGRPDGRLPASAGSGGEYGCGTEAPRTPSSVSASLSGNGTGWRTSEPAGNEPQHASWPALAHRLLYPVPRSPVADFPASGLPRCTRRSRVRPWTGRYGSAPITRMRDTRIRRSWSPVAAAAARNRLPRSSTAPRLPRGVPARRAGRSTVLTRCPSRRPRSSAGTRPTAPEHGVGQPQTSTSRTKRMK
jgi:hypothetical protein